MASAERTLLRKEKIRAREGISADMRAEMSARISERLARSAEFCKAQTIMFYRAVRAEVDLSVLEEIAACRGKTLAYPLCVSDTEMISLVPCDEDAWMRGYHGIMEPDPDRSREISPKDLDLIICPCSVFDRDCRRMGMGGGFYDRFLVKRRSDAAVAAAAFEVQMTDHIPADLWDYPMDAVFTELRVYRRKTG